MNRMFPVPDAVCDECPDRTRLSSSSALEAPQGPSDLEQMSGITERPRGNAVKDRKAFAGMALADLRLMATRYLRSMATCYKEPSNWSPIVGRMSRRRMEMAR